MSDPEESPKSELVKSKKVRSPAQAEAFKKAQAVRHERLRNLNKPKVEQEPAPVEKRVKVKKAPIVIEESDSEEEEPQQIVIRRRRPTRRPKIVYEDYESEEEEPREERPAKREPKRLPAPSTPMAKKPPPPPPSAQSFGMVFL